MGYVVAFLAGFGITGILIGADIRGSLAVVAVATFITSIDMLSKEKK